MAADTFFAPLPQHHTLSTPPPADLILDNEHAGRKVALFILALGVLGGALFSGVKLLDLNIDFSTQGVGLAQGVVVSLIIAARAALAQSDSRATLVSLMVGAVALVVILGTMTSFGSFSTQWKGLLSGMIVSGLAIKIVKDLGDAARAKKEYLKRFPTLWEEPCIVSSSIKALKTFAAALLIAVLLGGICYGGAHLFGANPDAALSVNASSLIAGGVVATVAICALYTFCHRQKFYMRPDNYLEEKSLPPKQKWALLLAGAAILIVLVVLNQTHTFSDADAFKPWQGAVVGAGFVAIALTVTAIFRYKSLWEKRAQKAKITP